MSELDVIDAIAGLEETTRLRIVNKTVSNFALAEAEQQPLVPLWVEGILQSVHPRALLVKPEGQRQWKWWDFWCTERLLLDWVLEDPDGVKLRVMARMNWSSAGYFHYELTEGPTP
jgi:hypothetical protein